MFHKQKIDYYLDEDNNWDLSIQELERAYQQSLVNCEPRAIVIINPGNPTGHVLTQEKIQEVVKWAYEKKLIIIADEVILNIHNFEKCLQYFFCLNCVRYTKTISILMT